ncbi:hypothetical protein EV178_000671 [Coemansia sp. RSA 1646]|nr:hypothetical protein EV178_000671 [Coemansia sp. RSA 1646]KAJ1773244.1 hypothetical protein LPJ74_000754 [Coemansia sp. RSA 1843]KAJ2092711.1 hypothetical protein IW138_000805 [Coemansia sp. RSA 986]KAJ2217791.1 hypothetical protein EV179_000277 [Coemansia sp. RSA 487]
MRALLGAFALVLLAPRSQAYSLDIQSTNTLPDQAPDMPIVAFTTLTMPESPTQLAPNNDSSGSAAPSDQIDGDHAQELPLPLNLVNERIRKKMEQDIFKFKNVNLHLTDSPIIPSESIDIDSTSSIISDEQQSGTPTSSAPQVLSVNVVMPTFAIRITEDPGAPNVDTVITIASFINSSEESTRIIPIFDAAEATPESQRIFDPVARFTAEPATPLYFPDRNPSVAAVQRHEITLDEMELLSILHMQSVAPMVVKTAPSAGFYGLPMQTPSVAQEISSAPVFSVPSLYPNLPLPQPATSTVEPSRSRPTSRHRSKGGLRPMSLSSGKPHRSAFTGLPPDPVVPGVVDETADSFAGEAVPVSSSRAVATQKVYVPSVPSSSLLQLPQSQSLPLPASSPPARSYYMPSHSPQQEVSSIVLQYSQPPVITVLLHPTHVAAPALEPQASSSAEHVVLMPPPSETTVTPPPPLLANSPAMLVDSTSQQNTPIIPFISNGSRLPVPTPQETKTQEVKGDINASGLASILENVLHIPANAITINGKPISENSNISVGNKGQGNIVIVGGKGVGGLGVNGGDDDNDDDLDADSDNESTTTHMLDVDRARNHRRIGSKTIDFDVNSSTHSNDASGESSDDDDDSDDEGSASDSDDDSDSNDATDDPSLSSSTSSSSVSSLTSSTSANVESTTLSSTESTTSSSSSILTLSSPSATSSSSTVPSETHTTTSPAASPSSSSSSIASSISPSPSSSSTTTENAESVSSLLRLARLLST